MFRTEFTSKMASIRTLMPLALLGYAFFWALLLLVCFGKDVSASPFDVSLLRLMFIVGVFISYLFIYLKKDFISDDKNDPLSLFSCSFCALVGVSNVASEYLLVPLVFQIAFWMLAGGGFGLMSLKWAKIFSIEWRRDVNLYLALSAALAAVMYLFCSNLMTPYNSFALVLMPFASYIAYRYVLDTCVGVKHDEKRVSEDTQLYLSTGLSLMLLGTVFGSAMYLVSTYTSQAETFLIALIAMAGALTHVVMCSITKEIPSLIRCEKLALLFCLIFLVLAIILGGHFGIYCALILVGVWIFVEIANYSALVGFASGHAEPFTRVARGEFVIVGGSALGWCACFIVDNTIGNLVYLAPFAGLIIIVCFMLLGVFMPLQENTYVDKSSDGDPLEGGYFSRRCQNIAKKYKLSERESEILVYLAKGRNAQYISDDLVISIYTVKTHIYHIYQKMGISSRQELISMVDDVEVEYTGQ